METHCGIRVSDMDSQVMGMNMNSLIQYSETNPHPKWEDKWFSKSSKYGPITDFSDFDCIEEITVWDKVTEITVPSHTYVLNRAGHCCGYFPRNDLNNWVEFGRPNLGFSKSKRKFKKVKIGYIPVKLENL
jgi:hypothetical protein